MSYLCNVKDGMAQFLSEKNDGMAQFHCENTYQIVWSLELIFVNLQRDM